MDPPAGRRAGGPAPHVRLGRSAGVRRPARRTAGRRRTVAGRDDPVRRAGLPAVGAPPERGAVVVTPFDVCGPLPQDTTVLEASAGTGKTFTIAALTTRYVAEGVAELADIMLVTFGNAASRELRDRVRERLVSAERGLRDPDAARKDEDDS